MSQNTETNAKNRYLQNHFQESRQIIRSLKARQNEKRSRAEKIADFMTASFGSIGFLIINVVWFAVWIVINLEIIPGLAVFHPFPFGLLTMIVSLEP